MLNFSYLWKIQVEMPKRQLGFHGWVFACYLQIGVFERQAATYETWFRGVCWLDGVSQQVG